MEGDDCFPAVCRYPVCCFVPMGVISHKIVEPMIDQQITNLKFVVKQIVDDF
jgi:hypothetical protein